jgi:serine/threonine protein kinase
VQRKPKWWVKLGDFGLAKKQTDGTAYRTKAGTEKYMAPELYYYVPGLNAEDPKPEQASNTTSRRDG